VLALGHRLGAQFDAQLLVEAQRTPAQIAADPGGDAGLEVTGVPPAVRVLTGTTSATRLLDAVVHAMIASHTLRSHVGGPPFPVRSPRGQRMLAVARPIRSGHPAALGVPAGVLVVGRPLSAVTGPVRGILVIELITGGGLILLLAAGGRWVIARGLAPLDRMARTAHRITVAGDLSDRMPGAGGSTEVDRLGRAINTMLDRIEQAFTARLRSEQAVRQFAADASHELRTPLTTIRGYAELYRQGALGDGDLPDAMRRIESEARRMSTLVAELLELARLDRTSSLDLAEVDLVPLVRDAVADALAVEPGRPADVRAPDRLVAVVDEARVRQVLANLLGNVREHTPPGTPVSVRLGRVDGQVLLEVADAGPGMPGQDAARAFDRFHRAARRNGDGAQRHHGDDSTGGSGLGLAIVQAIAQAHGGRAALDSQQGHGTRVRIWLPGGPPDSAS
jgi:signal transduction histidine kinase